MAKHNYVILYGQVVKKPTIIKSDETGEYVRGYCPIICIRGIRDAGAKEGNNIAHLKYDSPVIITGNPDRVREMSEWDVGDMVEVKGAITTKDIVKCTTCKSCQHKNKRKGNAVFINPIYMSIRERGVNEAAGIELLKKRCEISNQATIIGTLCREPQCFVTEKGLHITTYQLAVNRKFRIKEDAAEIRTDFPWIKSYGAIAENDFKTLKKGAYIFVDGMVQTRDIERTQVCEHCGQEYKWRDSALEIVPFATEYLRDYYTKEEIEQREKEEIEKAVKSVFKESDIPKPEFDVDIAADTGSEDVDEE